MHRGRSDRLGLAGAGSGRPGLAWLGFNWVGSDCGSFAWIGVVGVVLVRFASVSVELGVQLAWPDSIVALRLRSTRRRSRGSIKFHPITLPFRERSPPLSQTGSGRVRVEWVELGWFWLRLDGAGVNWTGCNCVAGDSGRLHWAPHACHGVD